MILLQDAGRSSKGGHVTFDRYLGIPYRDRGRDRSGCDCWGLVHFIYRDALGITLPSFDEHYVTAEDRHAMAALIAGKRDDWRDLSESDARPFDAVLMTQAGIARHIGILVQKGFVLHVDRGGTSRIDRLRSPHLRARIAGFWRHATR